MDTRELQHLRRLADRYAKTCEGIKQWEGAKKRTGELLQAEMTRLGVVKAEGTKVIVSLVSGERISEVNSLRFYEAVPEPLQSKVWEALSVLVEKARKLVGEEVLKSLGKVTPFSRLVIRAKNGESETQGKAAI